MSTGILFNRICLITGSSRGIGLGVARVFAENGARVILHGRNENLLRQSLAELSEPKQHSYITADINTPEGAVVLAAAFLRRRLPPGANGAFHRRCPRPPQGSWVIHIAGKGGGRTV